MKKHILIFSLLALLFGALSPVEATSLVIGGDYAIFNWRNDSSLNAFLNCDVDSITFSRVDLSGNEHPNVVVQEIWTPDSVYRIPIAAIDSVSFRAPEPIIKNNVFHITEFHFPYVTELTDSTITFNAAIPSDSLPRVGEVVITDIYDEPFDHGFAGRVVNTVTTNDNVIIECEQVTLEDIYDQLVCIGRSIGSHRLFPFSGAPKKINAQGNGVLEFRTNEWSSNITDNGEVTLTVTPSICFDYAICYNLTGTNNSFKFIISPTLDCEYGFNWEKNGQQNYQVEPLPITIPTQIPGLNAYVNVGAFLDLNGSVNLKATLPFTLKANVGYDSNRENPVICNFYGSGVKVPNGAVSFSGSAYTGLSLAFGAFLFDDELASAGIHLKAGPRVNVNAGMQMSFDTNGNNNSNWYNSFKDSYITLDPVVANASIEVKTAFFNKTVNIGEHSFFPTKIYHLFPAFSAPALTDLTDNAYSHTALTSDISRNLIFSITPGIRLYKGNELKYQYFSDSTYNQQIKWVGTNLQMEMKDYSIGTYTAKPIFKIFNSIVEASPTSSVTIPESLSLPEVIAVKRDAIKYIDGIGGWGAYSLTNSNTTISSASFVSADGNVSSITWPPSNNPGYENETPKIKIKGSKYGNTTLELTDKRLNETRSAIIVVNETGNTPKIVVSPTSYNFGTVVKGKTASFIFNVLCSDLDGVLEVSTDGDTGMFTVNSNINSDGGNITVEYMPTAEGRHHITITIYGVGIKETITVNGICVIPSITPSPQSLDFGNVAVGATSRPLTITLTGQYLTENITIGIDGQDGVGSADEFTVKMVTTSSTLARAQVTFTPESTGSSSRRLTFKSGDVYCHVDVSGNGIGIINANPSSVDCGTVNLNNSTVVSTGTFTITGQYLTGNLSLSSDNPVFTVRPSTITPEEATSGGKIVTVTYSPTSRGTHTGKITIRDGNNARKIVNVSGKCIKPSISVSPTNWTGINLVMGIPKRMTFTVTGTDLSKPVTVALGQTDEHATISINKSSVSSGGQFMVTCTPEKAGSFAGNISLSSEGAPPVTTRVSGTVKSVITTDKSTLNYSATGQSVEQTVQCKGANSQLTLTMSGDITKFTGVPSTIPQSEANAGKTFVVICKAPNVDSASATVTITGGGADPKEFYLSYRKGQPVSISSTRPD